MGKNQIKQINNAAIFLYKVVTIEYNFGTRKIVYYIFALQQ